MFTKETTPFFGSVAIIAVLMIIGMVIYGIDYMAETYEAILASIPYSVRLAFCLVTPFYLVLMGYANDPLFFLRKCFVRKGSLWLRNDAVQSEKEPFFWSSSPSKAKPPGE